MFAATYPDRVSSLILVNGTARIGRAEGYPVGIPEPILERYMDLNAESDAVERGFDMLADFAPSVADDRRIPRLVEPGWQPRRESGDGQTARPREAPSRRPPLLLPVVQVPTLVLHRRATASSAVEQGRYLAEHIPGAKYVELPGADDLYWVGDTGAMLDEIEEFVTGVRHGPESDRVLATVVFTDIVGASERRAEVGDVGGATSSSVTTPWCDDSSNGSAAARSR